MPKTLLFSEQNFDECVIHLAYPKCSIRLVRLEFEIDSYKEQSEEEVILRLRAFSTKNKADSIKHIPLRVSLQSGKGSAGIQREFPMEHHSLFEGELIFDQIEICVLNAEDLLERGKLELVFVTLPGAFEEKRMLFQCSRKLKSA